MSISDRVPPKVRKAVIERDSSCCRVCGRYVENPGLHHIVYRSSGGLDVAENLVVVGWLPGHDCHLPIAHGPRSRLFRELLLQCAGDPSVTALQLARWQRAAPA